MDIKAKKGGYIETLLRSAKTVFSTKDIALLWREAGSNAMRVRLNKYAKAGKLIRVRRGIYAKDENYDRFEMATRIYTPCYVSFETVLTRAGINFQYYETIFVASYVKREINVDGQTIAFERLRKFILTDASGVEHERGYAIATKERAFLDRIYVSKDYHFDHLDILDWDKVFAILPIYQSKRMKQKVQEYFENYKNNA